MTVHLVRGCTIDPDTGGLILEFVTPSRDVSASGLVLNHALMIPPEDAFSELLDDVEAVLQRTLSAALDIFAGAPPLVADEPAEDETSPFDNPTERA